MKIISESAPRITFDRQEIFADHEKNRLGKHTQNENPKRDIFGFLDDHRINLHDTPLLLLVSYYYYTTIF